jgi:hypothetical protein
MNDPILYKSFDALGEIRFGLSREEVRSKLSVAFQSFKKTPLSKNETDAFNSLGLHIYYDDEGTVDFIEVFEPCQVCYADVLLLNQPTNEVLERLKSSGLASSYEDGSYFYYDHGFALIDEEGIVSGASFFCKDYYA